MPQSMEKIAEEVNSSFTFFAKEHKIPKEHFVFIYTNVHPVVLSASRKLKLLYRPFSSLIEDIDTAIYSLNRVTSTISKEYSNHELSRTNKYTLDHLAVWNKDYSKVIAFSNLEFARTTISDLRHNSTFKNENVIFPIHTAKLKLKITEDIENGKTSAWYPFHRGIKRLGVRHEKTISQFLARYLLFDNKPMTEIQNGAQIVDFIATRVLDMHKPSEFCFADSVKEVREMYKINSSESPTSCMDSNHRFSFTKGNPVDFYSYCPITRGALVKRGDVVLARTICWHDVHNKKWYYGRVYAYKTSYGDALVQELTKLGFSKLNHEDSRFNGCLEDAPTVSFTVPEHTSSEDGAIIFPIPYLDRRPYQEFSVVYDYSCNHWVAYISFNTEGERKLRKELEGQSLVYPDVRTTYGFWRLDGSDVDYVYCHNCEDELHREDAIQLESGEYFCSEDCADDMDYYNLHQSSNTRRIHVSAIRQDYPYAIPAFCQNAWFSNVHAAIMSSASRVYRPTPFADTEQTLFCSSYESVNLGRELTPTKVYPLRKEVVLFLQTEKREEVFAKVLLTNLPNEFVAPLIFDPNKSEAVCLPIDTMKGTTSIAKSFTNKPYEAVKLSNTPRLVEYDFDKENSEVQKLFKEVGFPSELFITHANFKFFITGHERRKA